jgi:RHS repeat-associated protein
MDRSVFAIRKMRVLSWALGMAGAGLLSLQAVGAELQWNPPNHGYIIQAMTPQGIPQTSGTPAKVSGTITFVGDAHGKPDALGKCHNGKVNAHGKGNGKKDCPPLPNLLDQLSEDGVTVQAFFPDQTSDVSQQITLQGSPTSIQFSYTSPNLNPSSLNTFTIQVLRADPNVKALQAVQSKLEARIAALNALKAKLAAQQFSSQDLHEIQSLLGALSAISARITQKIQAGTQVIAQSILPLQVGNVVTSAAGLNSSLLGHFRVLLSADRGTSIDGEKTTLHARITRLGDWNDGSADDSDDGWWGDDSDKYVAQFFWKGSKVKETSPQAIADGATVSFDLSTAKLEPEDLNTWEARLYSWDQEDGLGKLFADLTYLHPVANDATSPTWLAGATPNSAHSCGYDMQPVSITAFDVFGLVDPSSVQANLSGVLTDGTNVSSSVTSKLVLTSPDQGQTYLIQDSGTINPPQQGKYTFSIASKDLAENATLPNPYTATFRVDRTAPVVQLAVDDAAVYTNKPYTNRPGLSFGVTTIDYFDLCSITTTAFDNGVQFDQTSAATLNTSTTMSEGLNLIEVKASNASDGLASDTQSFQVILDTVPPVLSGITPVDGAVINTLSFPVKGKSNEPLLSATLNGQAMVVSADGKSFSGTYTAQTEGFYPLTIEAKDLATNATTAKVKVQVLLRALNGDLLSVVPDADGVHLLIKGAPGATRPGLTVNADAGLLSRASAVGGMDGSFTIRMFAFRQATVSAYDPSLNRSDSAIVAYGAGSDTILSGVVKDTSDNLLPGVTLRIAGTSLTAVTDASGVFKFAQPVLGDQKLIVDGATIPMSVTGPNKKFSALSIVVNIGLSQSNVLQRPIYLAPLTIDTAITVDSAADVTVTDTNAPGVQLDIPAGAATFPDGSKNGVISMSVNPASRSTVPPLAFAQPKNVISLEPSGTKFNHPVTLTLNNENHLPPGVELVILSMNSSSGTWEIDGVAKVSSDGSKVVTKQGQGITHFSTIYASPIAPTIRPIGGQDAPGADTFSGALTASIQLPSFKSLGESISPSLIYKSSWAKPTTLVTNLVDIPHREIPVDFTSNGSRPISYCTLTQCDDDQDDYYVNVQYVSKIKGTSWYEPNSVSSQFTAGSITSDKYNFTGVPNQSTISYAVDMKDPSSGDYVSSGVYPYVAHYDITLDQITVGTQSTRSWSNVFAPQVSNANVHERQKLDQAFPQDLTGAIYVQNEVNSAAGRGWKVAGVQRIVNPSDSRVMLEEADGSLASYALNNTINTLYNANGAAEDLNQGTDVSSWPNAFMFQPSGARVVRKNLSDSSPVVDLGGMYGVGGTLRGFLYVDVDPDRHASDNYSSCYRLYQNYSITPRPQQFTMLSDGTLVGTDQNRHTLFSVSGGATSLFAGRYYGPPSSFSYYPDRIMCKDHDGICLQNNDDNGAAIDINGIRSSMQGWMSSGCQGLPNSSCSGQWADDYNVNVFGGCGGGAYSSGNYASGTASPGDTSMSSPLNAPMGITAGTKPNTVIVADYSNNRVMLYDRGAGSSSVVAGNISGNDTGDGGKAINAGIYHPRGVAYDSVGNLYISSENGFIRKVDPTGLISTLAGGGGVSDNAPADKMAFRTPTGLVVDNLNGYLYVADTGNNRVMKIDLQSKWVSVVAGNSSCVGDSSDLGVGEGSAALNASLCAPTNLGLDADNNLLIVDSGHQRVRRVVFQSANNGVLAFAPVQKDFSVLSRNADGTWKRTYRNGRSALFAADGKETQQMDRAGRVTSFGYDSASGLLTTITDPTQRSIIFTYSGGYLSSITDPAGRITKFNIVGGMLSSVIFPDGNQKSYGFNQKGLISSETDQRGKTTQYIYNDWNRLKTVIRPDGTQMAVSDSGSQTVAAPSTPDSSDPSQANSLKSYGMGADEVHDSITDPNGEQTAFVKAYDGHVSSMVDGQGKQSSVDRDKWGRPTKVTRPDGSYVSYAYEPTYGDLVSQYDSYTGITTGQQFDRFGNITSKTNGRGFTSLTEYNIDGQVSKKTDPLGNKTTYQYNAPYKLMSSVTDSLSRTTSYQYNNGSGNVTQVTAPGNLVSRLTLDPNGTGNPVASINPKGQKTQFEFDSMNRLTALITPKQERIEYTYLPTGQLSQVKDPLGNFATQEYDDLARVIKKTDFSGFQTSFTFDSKGNLSLVVDPNGNQKQYVYDSQNRLIKKILPDNLITISYNDRGDITRTADVRSQIDFGYNTIGQLTSVQTQGLGILADLPNVTLGFEFDEDGNRKKLIDPFGATTYLRDANDRLTSITNPKGETFAYSYNDSTGEVDFKRPGVASSTPIETRVAIDQSGFLSSIIHSVSGQAINSFVYQRDTLGSPTQITTAQGARTIAYNDNEHVISASNPEISAGDPSKMNSESFDYDSIYNRKNDQGGSYSYDNKSQRLVQDYRYFYFYDNNGNLRSKQAIGMTGEVTNYFYSSENQLLGFKVYTPASYDPSQIYLVGSTQPVREVYYDYDAEGRRLQKRVIDHAASNSDVTKNFVRRYVYDGAGVLAEYDGQNHPLVRYTHSTLGMDDIIAVDVKQPGVDQRVAQAVGTYYYLKDGLGSIIDVVDNAGQKLQHYIYSAYGQLLGIQDAYGADISSNPVLATSQTFTGRDWDKESGLYYFRARYYDPNTGRFLQKDPAPGSLSLAVSMVNSYTYAGNNPLSITDPSGQSFWSIFKKIACVVAISVAAVVTGGAAAVAAIAALGIAAGTAGAIAVGAVVGAATGALAGGVVGGTLNALQGKSFAEGFWHGAVQGAISGAFAGAFAAASSGSGATASDTASNPTAQPEATNSASDVSVSGEQSTIDAEGTISSGAPNPNATADAFSEIDKLNNFAEDVHKIVVTSADSSSLEMGIGKGACMILKSISKAIPNLITKAISIGFCTNVPGL